MTINIFLALFAGVISFISPCVLPLVPMYIAYVSGLSVQEIQSDERPLMKIFINTLFFVIGFTLVFTLFAFLFYTAINTFGADFKLWFNRVAGVFLIIFGLHTMGVFTIPFLNYQASFKNEKSQDPTLWSSFVMGLIFAAGWTPCVGPILSGILALAGNAGGMSKAAVLLVTYSLGLGIPFILTGLLTGKLLSLFKNIKKHYKLIEIIAGLFLILLGVLLLFDGLTILSNWFSQIPGLADVESRILKIP